MAYNYMSIANEIFGHFGETRLDDTTFSTVTDPFQLFVLEKINTAIYDICVECKSELPFVRTEKTEALAIGPTYGLAEYMLPEDCASVDWDSFYIDYDSALDSPESSEIAQMDYNLYRKTRRTSDLNVVDSTGYSRPRYVVRTQVNTFYLSPKPDQEYTMKYEYFAYPDPLSDKDDVPIIPVRHKSVIIDQVMYYAYLFRDNIEAAQLALASYEKRKKYMKRELLLQADTMRSI